jgi:hypothetical protein
VGLGTQQDLAGWSGLLEPGGGVDGVAGGERPARAGRARDTDPVLTPVRTSSRTPTVPSSSSESVASARVMSYAARTARSASSSRTSGTPNTASTASPTNFSTVPPCRSTASRATSK